MKVTILIPSLRTERWPAIKENLAATCDATPAFLGREFPSYARAVNMAYGFDASSMAPSDYYFTGSDDLTFFPGWLEEALYCMGKQGVEVVGTNDLFNGWVMEGKHATHYLVSASYLREVGGVIDQGPGSFLYEYDHGYTDSEFIETAIHRGVFESCHISIVQHNWRPPSDDDPVSLRTDRAIKQDYETFVSRRHLWGGGELPYSEPETEEQTV